MNKHIKLIGISGSLRKDSYNTMLLAAVGKLLPSNASMDVLSFADLPIYNGDDDIPQVKSRPEPVNRFRKAIADADGLVIVSPEYNHSIPGGLKNAIDWASRGNDSPLIGKPVAVLGATDGLWGTVLMQEAFLVIFQTLNMKPVMKPEVLVAKAKEKFDDKGQLKDELAIELIRKKLQGLCDIVLHDLADRPVMAKVS